MGSLVSCPGQATATLPATGYRPQHILNGNIHIHLLPQWAEHLAIPPQKAAYPSFRYDGVGIGQGVIRSGRNIPCHIGMASMRFLRYQTIPAMAGHRRIQ